MHLQFNNPHVDYFMDAIRIQGVHEEKDLGVIDLKWDKQCDIKLIEGVQRRATKLVHGIKNWKYDGRLKFLDLTRLEKKNKKCFS